MTDKEILDKVYERLKDRYHSPEQKMFSTIDFIQQEWQRRDEEEMGDHPLTKSDEGQMYNVDGHGDIHSTDVKEIERHRGLEIGSDGTVINLK